MKASLLTASSSLGLCTLLLGAAQAAHPPYLTARHRSIIVARADSPPACASKQAAANSTAPPVVGTNTTEVVPDDAIPSAAVNNTSFNFTATDTFPLPSATSLASDNSTDFLNATGTALAFPTATPATNASVNTTDPLDPSSADPSTALRKRIAQFDLPDVAAAWQELCLISGADNVFTPTGEDSPCVKLAGFDGINALLANSDPCAQQDNADSMIDFAKSANIRNKSALISFAITYRKHPRNALNILGTVPSTPYCQRAPRNAELNGVVNEQLDGVDPGVFGGPNSPVVAFGAPGTCPFGTTPDVSTCSCIPSNVTDTLPPLNSTANATATETSLSDLLLPSASASLDSNVTDTSAFEPTPVPDASATATADPASFTDTFDSPLNGTDSLTVDATDSPAFTSAFDASVPDPTPTDVATDGADADPTSDPSFVVDPASEATGVAFDSGAV
ncbi:hypothetical protein ONZ45_g16550 [Pleurotus djamor]|nr:hypothetical protein ONZ45_g16550 [Pleurotus djamor]